MPCEESRLRRAARGDPTIVFVSVTLKDQAQETLSRFEDAIRLIEID